MGKDETHLIYGLEDGLPVIPAIFVSIQQVSAMVVGTITPALILAGMLHFTAGQTAYIISMTLMVSALGTFLQTMRLGLVGSGLLSIAGTSFAFIGPLSQAGLKAGLPLMIGMSLSAIPVQLLLAPLLPRLKKIFTPLVSGVVVLLIGMTLIPTGMANIVHPHSSGHGGTIDLLIAAIVITVIVLANVLGKGWLRMSAVIIAVAVGYVLTALFGHLEMPAANDGTLVRLPQIFPFGIRFDWSLLLPFAFIYLVSVLESMGDITVTARLSGLDTHGKDFWQRMRGGILADGISCIAAGIVGSFPVTTYAQNNGVIQMTGVASRRIGWLMALILFLLGLFPAVGRLITVMPPAVLGALALLLFGIVAIAGLKLIASVGLDHRNSLIAALSLGLGIGIPSQPDWIRSLPDILQTFLASGVSVGGVTALVLNIVLPNRD